MQNNKKDYIFGVAGGSGGHILPTLEYLNSQKRDNSEIIFFSNNSKLDTKILSKYQNNIEKIVFFDFDKFPRKNLFKYPVFILQFAVIFFSSLKFFFKYRPKSVIATGGHIAFPVCIAAYFSRISVELFELNVVPGRTIKWLAPFSEKINICFESTRNYFSKYKIKMNDYPIRFNDQDILDKSLACNKLGLNLKKKTLMILGGSQGSVFFNKLIIDFVKKNKPLLNGFQIIHQANSKDLSEIEENYKSLGVSYYLFDFKTDINVCYSAADLIISRAGAGSLFELKFFKKQSIIIPLNIKYSTHQVDNALSIKKSYENLFDVFSQEYILNDINKFFDFLIKKLDL